MVSGNLNIVLSKPTSLQALSLAQYDVQCAIIDQSDVATMRSQSFDGRTSAITSASMNMLNLLKLDTSILGQGADIEKIILTKKT